MNNSKSICDSMPKAIANAQTSHKYIKLSFKYFPQLVSVTTQLLDIRHHRRIVHKTIHDAY